MITEIMRMRGISWTVVFDTYKSKTLLQSLASSYSACFSALMPFRYNPLPICKRLIRGYAPVQPFPMSP